MINNTNIKIAAITVTYHPLRSLLAKQMHELYDCIWIVVDNGSSGQETIEVKQLLKNRSDTYFFKNENNLGLAAAINQGVAYLDELKLDVDFVLLLDQDSVPMPESIHFLYTQLINLEHQGFRVGCVGPKLMDTRTAAQHGFHQMHHGIWSRYYPAENSKDPVPCANINGSGTLMRKSLFDELGGLDSSFFIDHIDTEWSFRMLSRGYELFGIPHAVFEHQMGEDSLRFWLFGWNIWPLRSPLRQY